jgi:phosphoserine phosphatase
MRTSDTEAGATAPTYKLAVFDMDGTLTDCVSSWQYYHERLGIWDGEASVHQGQFRRGEISYEEFARLDAGHWAGLPLERLEQITAEVNFLPDVKECLGRMKEDLGLRLVVISSGLTVMTDRARLELGVDQVFANRLVISEGLITGQVDVVVPIGGKGRVLQLIQERFRVQPEETVAVGDSRDDLDLFSRAGLTVAVNPRHEELAERADLVCNSGGYPAILDLVKQKSHPSHAG